MDIPVLAPASDPASQARNDRRKLRYGLLVSALFVALLWWIKAFEIGFDIDLGGLGNRPREAWGLLGVITAPLLHGSFKHLVSNTLPLLILGTLAFSTFPRAAARASLLIWLGSGLSVWLLARGSNHIGASGLNHGLMFLLLTLGLIRRDRIAVAASLIAFFMYGGMLLTVLPSEPGVSWEYHLGGAVFGILGGLLWSALDPLPPRKVYSWELEEALEAEQHRLESEDSEPARPNEVQPIWQGPDRSRKEDERRGVVIAFRRPAAPPNPDRTYTE